MMRTHGEPRELKAHIFDFSRKELLNVAFTLLGLIPQLDPDFQHQYEILLKNCIDQLNHSESESAILLSAMTKSLVKILPAFAQFNLKRIDQLRFQQVLWYSHFIQFLSPLWNRSEKEAAIFLLTELQKQIILLKKDVGLAKTIDIIISDNKDEMKQIAAEQKKLIDAKLSDAQELERIDKAIHQFKIQAAAIIESHLRIFDKRLASEIESKEDAVIVSALIQDFEKLMQVKRQHEARKLEILNSPDIQPREQKIQLLQDQMLRTLDEEKHYILMATTLASADQLLNDIAHALQKKEAPLLMNALMNAINSFFAILIEILPDRRKTFLLPARKLNPLFPGQFIFFHLEKLGLFQQKDFKQNFYQLCKATQQKKLTALSQLFNHDDKLLAEMILFFEAPVKAPPKMVGLIDEKALAHAIHSAPLPARDRAPPPAPKAFSAPAGGAQPFVISVNFPEIYTTGLAVGKQIGNVLEVKAAVEVKLYPLANDAKCEMRMQNLLIKKAVNLQYPFEVGIIFIKKYTSRENLRDLFLETLNNMGDQFANQVGMHKVAFSFHDGRFQVKLFSIADYQSPKLPKTKMAVTFPKEIPTRVLDFDDFAQTLSATKMALSPALLQAMSELQTPKPLADVKSTAALIGLAIGRNIAVTAAADDKKNVARADSASGAAAAAPSPTITPTPASDATSKRSSSG